MKTAPGWEFGSENHGILSANSASAIRRALENAGVELNEENGGGPGARLNQRLSDQSFRRAASLANRK